MMKPDNINMKLIYIMVVLTPIKSMFKFNAINITAGLPFIRVSPDHGPNETMISKNISDQTSIIQSINFFERSV